MNGMLKCMYDNLDNICFVVVSLFDSCPLVSNQFGN